MVAYQWHQEEEQTNQERLCTILKPKTSKDISSLFPTKVLTMNDHNKKFVQTCERTDNGHRTASDQIANYIVSQ